ncbi:MAG: 3-oxoacyl-ACP reductase FabG, partial [Planctomycetes bacterium]|nr:3-oxoacyl-ACP reductase FabG [Planctomycetota bacterium]
VVCVHARAGSADALLQRLSDRALQVVGHSADVSQADEVERLAAFVQGRWGRCDILVNNAGITWDGVFLRMGDEVWDRVLGVNLRGTFLCARAFSRGMAKARWGRIVNVGSVVGLFGSAGQANYAASKAGLVGLSRSLALELAGRGVTVNVVAPGFIETDMTSGLPERRAEAIRAEIPLRRLGRARDVAEVVSFLAGSSGGYVTGATLRVDGGLYA